MRTNVRLRGPHAHAKANAKIRAPPLPLPPVTGAHLAHTLGFG